MPSSASILKTLCQAAPLPVCFLLSQGTSEEPGIVPVCYARVALFANTFLHEGPTALLHLLALALSTLMLFNVRRKYAAVGRREFLLLLIVYMTWTFLTLCLDAGVVTRAGDAFPWLVAIQLAFGQAVVVCLVATGLVGFRWKEDGTWTLLSTILVAAFVSGGAVFTLTVSVAHSWLGLSPLSTLPLFLLLGPLNGILIASYAIMQVVLLCTKVKEYWALGNLFFGLVFILSGQVVLYSASNAICLASGHYLDGTFVATGCNLLAMMMVYKFYDSITTEELEFSVDPKQQAYRRLSLYDTPS